MSFRNLPQELKERITLFVDRADKAYLDRTEEFESIWGSNSRIVDPKLSKFWGKGIVTLSLVNKECRSLSAVHLFSTIAVSKMEEHTFTDLILGSPLGENFTTVDFDSYDPHQLRFALVHILPRLPRLESVQGLDQSVIVSMFGAGGMEAVRKLKYGRSNESDKTLNAWNKFKAFAKRIKRWQVQLEGEEVEVLLSIDPIIKANLRSLVLTTPEQDGFAIMEAESSKFPAILEDLPSLKLLSISQAISLANSGEYFRKPLSKIAISTSYQFTTTLTSFTFVGSPGCVRVDVNFVRFLARFTSLRFLRIEAETLDSFPEKHEAITFENLEELYLYGERVEGLDWLLAWVSFPKLRILTLKYQEFDSECLRYFDDLSSRIQLCSKTLQHVYLVGTGGFYLGYVKLLSEEPHKSISRPYYTFHTDFPPGIPESNASDRKASGFSVEVEIDPRDTFDGVMSGVEELSSWVEEDRERVRKNRDVGKAKQLLRSLLQVWELREWSRD
ncbi:hypothetical protein JCM3765_005181 [Sporobolomyces pararoseus]